LDRSWLKEIKMVEISDDLLIKVKIFPFIHKN